MMSTNIDGAFFASWAALPHPRKTVHPGTTLSRPAYREALAEGTPPHR